MSFPAYVALGTAVTFGTLAEFSGNGYTRVPINMSFDATNGIVNFSASTFPTATAAWNAAAYAGIYDAPTGGNLLFSFTAPTLALVTGQNLNIQGGAFKLTTNFGPTYLALPAASAIGLMRGTVNTVALGFNALPAGVAVSTGIAPIAWNGTALVATGTVSSLADGATITVDASTASIFSVTIAAVGRTLNLINGVNDQSILVEVSQDATGSRTVTAYTNATWPTGTLPTLSTAAGATDILRFTFNSLAAKWRGELLGRSYA